MTQEERNTHNLRELEKMADNLDNNIIKNNNSNILIYVFGILTGAFVHLMCF
jgi:hypothetical protein